MEPTSKLTIGDLLPADMKSDYSENVLNTPISEAIQIAKFDEPSTTGLDRQEISEIQEIYQTYQDEQEEGTNQPVGKSESNAYWNKSETDNTAYWDKNQS